MLRSRGRTAKDRRSVVRRHRRYLVGGLAALAFVLAGVAVPQSVTHHDVRADAKPESLPAHRHATFASALRAGYRGLIRRETQKYGAEFDRERFESKLAEIDKGHLPAPSKPEEYGLSDAVAVALSEGRNRLMRSMGGRARDAAALFTAQAQVAYDCWLFRAGARLPATDVTACRDRFAKSLADLENAVLPIESASPFNRTLAREYLAYAAFKASARGDHIDARHFARKGLAAARSDDPTAVEPEVLTRWNLDAGSALPKFLRWRRRLVAVIERHRGGARAAFAAKAQARFDCWVERVAERAAPAAVQKCESEFLDLVGQLEGKAPRHRSVAMVVLFDDARPTFDRTQYAQIKRAADLARRSGTATVSVIARTPDASAGEKELRLAIQRASAVAEALRRQGVRGDRIRTLYLREPAEGQVAGPGTAPTGARGQRAEIVIH